MRHFIQKQQLLLIIPQEIDAFQAQHAASRWLREQLLPMLERIFDELSGEGEVIFLDHFFIDLGVIGAVDFQKGIIDESIYRLMKAEVRKAIEKELAEHPGARSGTREIVLARWWYYMEHGRLPWNADVLTADDYRQVLEQLSIDYTAISRLRVVLKDNPLFGMRIVAQHTVEFLENVVAVLTSSRQEGLGELVAQASRAYQLLENEYHRRTGDLPEARREVPWETAIVQYLRYWAARMAGFLQAPAHEKKSIIWRRLLFEAAMYPAEFSITGPVGILLRDIPFHRSLLEMVLADQEGGGGETAFISALRRRLQALMTDAGDEPGSGVRRAGTTGPGTPEEGPSVKKEDESALSGRRRDESMAAESRAPSGADEDIPAERRSQSPVENAQDKEVPAAEKMLKEEELIFQQEDIDEDGIYLPNAGLILVHPFLPTLFDRTGFWDGAGFRDLEARQKAILLLHFLATGDRHPAEYSLVFAKMLCGYAVEMPLPGELQLEEEHCAEGLVMLDNIVQRWEKLGNSSMEGLREGFLRRNGKLFNRGGRLVLQVESSGIDVLLDYLPWNIGLVKLPWLKDILYVEWR